MGQALWRRRAARALAVQIRTRGGTPIIATRGELQTLMADRAYLHDLEVPCLARYAEQATGVIVEIGCAFGGSTALFLAHMAPTASVHSIDPFVRDSMRQFQASQRRCTRNVRDVLKRLGLEERLKHWRLHTAFSHDAIAGWSDPIDVLFIDGDHRYDAVKRDFDDWTPVVRTGGFILFHDSRKRSTSTPDQFDRGWDGPTRFVEGLRRSTVVEFVEAVHSISVFRKV